MSLVLCVYGPCCLTEHVKGLHVIALMNVELMHSSVRARPPIIKPYMSVAKIFLPLTVCEILYTTWRVINHETFQQDRQE